MPKIGASTASACLALAGMLHEVAAQQADCGGHYKDFCWQCPEDKGEAWCNGQCTWVKDFGISNGICMPKIPIPGMLPEDSPFAAMVYYWLYYFSTSLVVMLIFACVYYGKVVSDMPKVGALDATPARRGLFDCFSHGDTCLYTTLCLPIVVGKNYHIAKIPGGFWLGVISTAFMVYGPHSMWSWWPGLLIGFGITAAIRAILAAKVQQNLGFKPDYVKNCIWSMFCLPCDVGRESLEADQEIGVTVTCCCKATYTPKVIVEVENLVKGGEDRTCGKTRLCGGH